MQEKIPSLTLKRLGIETYKEAVVYMHRDCHVCLSEGFEVQARVKVTCNHISITATLNIVHSDLLKRDEVGVSEYAWKLLSAKEGDFIDVSHARPVTSLSYVRSKIYGNRFSKHELNEIVQDIIAGCYSDIEISSFLTACAGGHINKQEIVDLTEAMIHSGKKMIWNKPIIVDKHCVGGLPGNRTTPIIVAIVAAFGLTMPKTSSRAITSPAGTADTMEVFAPVELSIDQMKKVVEQENGCVVWGGSVALSPADDILIRVEKALNLDSEGQLVASVISKKIAAGATHVLIDIPIGATAKVRTQKMADTLKKYLVYTGKKLGLVVKVVYTDGSQPVGRGIGPALEAQDVLAVLRQDQDAPRDLHERALQLAGHVIEFSPKIKSGCGYAIAKDILESGRAWKKFQAICEAQGSMNQIPQAAYQKQYTSHRAGVVTLIDNRRLALIAKLAGAPYNKSAGVLLHVKIGDRISANDPLFAVHAESSGELDYAYHYLESGNEIIKVMDV